MVSRKVFETVRVILPNTDYPIIIGQHLIKDAAFFSEHIKSTQVLIVTNDTIANFYLESLLQALQHFDCDTIILPDGEAYKNQASITKIHTLLIEKKHHRDTTLIALGGGVIGDLTGFAASTYQRGVAYIQVPTTLLAAVDAAVGGKTAINYPGAKNAVGSFYQPKMVLVDIATFQTLPEREFQSGFAEVVKYALLSGDLSLSLKPLPLMIANCCRIKADFIADDIEDNKGRRALLNLGHTFGHALEAVTAYKRFLHGEAVAIGLYCATLLSYKLGNLPFEIVQKVHDLLVYHKLPCRIPADISTENLYELMWRDKKVTNKKIFFIVLKAPGLAYLNHDISRKIIKDLLMQIKTDVTEKEDEVASYEPPQVILLQNTEPESGSSNVNEATAGIGSVTTS